jgi:hypothetical protein
MPASRTWRSSRINDQKFISGYCIASPMIQPTITGELARSSHAAEAMRSKCSAACPLPRTSGASGWHSEQPKKVPLLELISSRLATPCAEQIAGSKLAVPFRIWISSIATALPFPFFTIEPPIKVEIVELPLSNRERTITSHFHKLIRIFW